jgi:hypothetical protein
MTLKRQKFIDVAALEAVRSGETHILARAACLHVANEEAADALRIKHGDTRWN